jgi:hypothetical protein
VIDVGGAIDVRASGGSGFVTAELLAIFDRFVRAEFDKDVAARTAEFGPDAPASVLPRSDSQRRFDALVAIFRAAVVAPANGVAPVPVVNLLVGFDTFERLVIRRVTGDDPGLRDDLDLDVERMEADTGTAVSPDDVLAAAVVGHVRRVVIDGSGVVVDAGRKRRLFSGVARQMALLLAHSCDHPGCTVPARLCQVDHLAEWERDDGGTDLANSKPRCNTHNPWKSAHRLRSKRDEFGNVVDVRDDGTAMVPVGRRLCFDDSDNGRTEMDQDVIEQWERRTIRVEFCRLRTSDLDVVGSYRLTPPT